MSKHKIEFDCECESCGATGLYKGMAERDGFAVVCHSCKGSGKVHRTIEYTDFEGRKPMSGVSRVVECNPGIILGHSREGEPESASFEGLSYVCWRDGYQFVQGTEMRNYTCPAWWNRTSGRGKTFNKCKGNFDSTFSACSEFPCKAACWKKQDAANEESKASATTDSGHNNETE